MSGFDEKLDSILNNPESLQRVMDIAKNLSAGGAMGGEPDRDDRSSRDDRSGRDDRSDEERDGGSSLDGMLKGLNVSPAMLSSALDAFGGGASDHARLLSALKPFMASERRDKVDGAITALKVAKAARSFLGGKKD